MDCVENSSLIQFFVMFISFFDDVVGVKKQPFPFSLENIHDGKKVVRL